MVADLTLKIEIERWPLARTFRISGYSFDAVETVLATLIRGGQEGRGEAAGVYYRGETVSSIVEMLKEARPLLGQGMDRQQLRIAMPAGGARNALDCALWDLEAREAGQPAWQLGGLEKPRPLITTFTCGAEAPEVMAEMALGYENARALKLKLTGEPLDAERVRAVRLARPEVWIGVDGNQGFDRRALERLMPTLIDADVALIEQPFPVGQEALLDDFQSPIPIAADESVQDLATLDLLPGRFNVVNLKLDKCGGLTEALAMVERARVLGLSTMVGNMMGTSLATAPAFLLGQACEIVDLDGPALLASDREPGVSYSDGMIAMPHPAWGDPGSLVGWRDDDR